MAEYLNKCIRSFFCMVVQLIISCSVFRCCSLFFWLSRLSREVALKTRANLVRILWLYKQLNWYVSYTSVLRSHVTICVLSFIVDLLSDFPVRWKFKIYSRRTESNSFFNISVNPLNLCGLAIWTRIVKRPYSNDESVAGGSMSIPQARNGCFLCGQVEFLFSCMCNRNCDFGVFEETDFDHSSRFQLRFRRIFLSKNETWNLQTCPRSSAMYAVPTRLG